MKHLKLFENLNQPQIGDYVKMNSDFSNELPIEKILPDFRNFIDNNIGQIIGINSNYYNVEYKIPSNWKYYLEIFPKGLFTKNFTKNQLINFDTTKEELELKLHIKKYNL